ncbi:hypothetical protein [uncultured Croceitalea sp.]|uniref:hypothetical protein n=1 Tax=uncultured Croceitalea sp. TaxID=1798908 RepID=UPI003305669C
MGRKSLKKNKERPVLFPEDNTKQEPVKIELSLGTWVKIGRPSNRYFQYIYASLDFFNLKLSDLNQLSELEGLSARVTGMIQMVNGDEIAIISKKDGNPFFRNFNKLFIDRKKALSNGEVILTE